MSESEKPKDESLPEEQNGKWFFFAVIAGLGVTVEVGVLLFPETYASQGEKFMYLLIVVGVFAGATVYWVVRYLIRKRRSE